MVFSLREHYSVDRIDRRTTEDITKDTKTISYEPSSNTTSYHTGMFCTHNSVLLALEKSMSSGYPEPVITQGVCTRKVNITIYASSMNLDKRGLVPIHLEY